MNNTFVTVFTVSVEGHYLPDMVETKALPHPLQNPVSQFTHALHKMTTSRSMSPHPSVAKWALKPQSDS